MKKKICVITGTRAEYGLLKNLLKNIKDDNQLELQLIITGMHLSPEFGLTYKIIEKDGFEIKDKIEILLSSDTDNGINKSIGLAMISFSESYSRLKPDMVIVLGDRYEILAATIAAYILKIPIAHISGGDITEGAYDDAFRHSITKMAYLHFPGTESSRKRIIQLGEAKERVFNFGDVGVENITKVKLYSKKELVERLNIGLKKKYFLVVMHSTTLDLLETQNQIKNLMKSLIKFKDYNFIFIKGNSDTNGREINNLIEEFHKKNINRVSIFTSLSIEEYLSLLKNSEGLVGNSSSGIIEAPSLEVLSLNIGERQRGREQASTTINCGISEQEITKGLEELIRRKRKLREEKIENPYKGENTSEKIVETIKEYLFGKKEINLKKKFYDIEF